MTRFRSEFNPKSSSYSLCHTSPILTLGSCFSEAIGNTLKVNKFDALVNPFGTVYNPLSIHQLLLRTLEKTYPSAVSYLQHQGLYYNYEFHSKFCGNRQENVVEQIKVAVDQAHTFVKSANVLILTYGTAFLYTRNDNGEAVANCHKQPGDTFNKRLLSVAEIVENFDRIYPLIKQTTTIERIILTVSPVRHLKDGIELNSVSKSILRMACHALTERYSDVLYFPAFEIMMDDLRDYRFYKSDLIHPSDMAEGYIWEKFSATYFDPSTTTLLQQWTEIRKALEHRPFQSDSPQHSAFLSKTLSQLEELKSKLNVEHELTEIRNSLKPIAKR